MNTIQNKIKQTIQKIKATISDKEMLLQLNSTFANQLKQLKEDLKKEQQHATKVSTFLKKALDTDISWYDFSELSPNSLLQYHEAAQMVLRNGTFQNELNFLKANWTKQAVLDLADKTSAEQQEHIQRMYWMILGIQLFTERLDEIPRPDKTVLDPPSSTQ